MGRKSSPQPALPPELQTSALDHGVALLRGLVGAVPAVGSLLVELVGTVIPQQRADRFAAYLAAVAARLEEACGDVAAVAQILERLSPGGQALFEDGARVAVRALTPERIQAIGRIVADGMTADEEESSRERLIVELLDVLTDSDIARLHGMAQAKSLGQVRAERVARGLPPDPVRKIEPTLTTPAEARALSVRRAEARALDGYEPSRLVRLGLLAEKLEIQPIKRTLSGDAYSPPPRAAGYQLTSMARLVLGRLERHGAIPG